MFPRTRLITTIAVAALGISASQAAGAPDAERAPNPPAEKLRILERPGERLQRSIDLHQARLERHQARLPDFASPGSFGVSQGALETIANCESGGDPTAVSSDGTYRGKYQFDSGTWASMGGSGDPAAAPEAEQDMRAAMLYAQSGSSPWPICGV